MTKSTSIRRGALALGLATAGLLVVATPASAGSPPRTFCFEIITPAQLPGESGAPIQIGWKTDVRCLPNGLG